MVEQTCNFCNNSESILRKETCCTGCSKLPTLCDGYPDISFSLNLNDFKNKHFEVICRCTKCDVVNSVSLSKGARITCDDPVLTEGRRVLNEKWKETHSKEMIGEEFIDD